MLKTIFNDAKMVCVLSSGMHAPVGSDERLSAKTPVPRDGLLGVITKIDLIDYLATRSVSP